MHMLRRKSFFQKESMMMQLMLSKRQVITRIAQSVSKMQQKQKMRMLMQKRKSFFQKESMMMQPMLSKRQVITRIAQSVLKMQQKQKMRMPMQKRRRFLSLGIMIQLSQRLKSLAIIIIVLKEQKKQLLRRMKIHITMRELCFRRENTMMHIRLISNQETIWTVLNLLRNRKQEGMKKNIEMLRK